ncbi:MAG: DUF4097 domain-containing protein [Ignavibacteriae bacterium]|nr:DUF4097 domain-containing protein [Ignavibacteriota bacterium]
MKKSITHFNSLLAVMFFLLAGTGLSAQETQVDKVNVPLSDPARPVKLEVGIMNGSITVKGVQGLKEVIVEAAPRYREESRRREQERKDGLKRIMNTTTGLTVEEDNNKVDVSTGMSGHSRTIDLTIQVPTNTAMDLSTVNSGDVYVENIVGDLEISNTNGKVTVDNISGSAVIHALNGNIVSTFAKVNQQSPMSFSSMNGRIDLTFPADMKATVFMKNVQGEIYTDFDMKVEQSAIRTEEGEGKRGKYKVSFERGMKGFINGGGLEIQVSNYNGDVYIRKGK